MTSDPRESALSHRSYERSLERTPMIPSSRAHFGEDSKDPPDPSAIRRELQRTPRAENALGAQTPIERSTGPRKDARGPSTTLFRDRKISRHSWVAQWPLKLIRLLLVCLCTWRPVRSLYARPTPSRGLRRPCLTIRQRRTFTPPSNERM